MGNISTAEKLPACPVETTLTLISDKWKVLILRDLLPGTKRFGELKKSIGHVSQTYVGYSLKPILDAMWTWGEEYQKKMEE